MYDYEYKAKDTYFLHYFAPTGISSVPMNPYFPLFTKYVGELVYDFIFKPIFPNFCMKASIAMD